MNADSDIYRLARQFRNISFELVQFRKQAFPSGSIVHVYSPCYVGHGIAAADSGCPADQVPVRLENGNTWWYPIEGVKRVTDLKSIPSSVRRMKFEFHGLKCARHINQWVPFPRSKEVFA